MRRFVLIAALILDAMAGSNSELVLRANCVLRESAKPTMILDKRFGESDELGWTCLMPMNCLPRHTIRQWPKLVLTGMVRYWR